MTVAAPPRKPPTSAKSSVTKYAEAVVRRKVVANRLVRLACERHLRDLKRPDIWFDEAEAVWVIEFYSHLALSGEWSGQPFVLEPWEQFIVGSTFGWKLPDGTRRFNVVYIEVGKSNGKTPLAGGTGLYMLTADGVERAEVYSAAVDRDQAQILFRDVVAMVDVTPSLDARLTRSGGRGKEWNLAYLDTRSFFRPISSEHTGGRGKSGFRVHCGLLDEVHEHPTAAMVDFMRANAKGRNSLIFMITNSGYDRSSVCYQWHDLSVRILEGAVENDSIFAYVCGLDPCDQHRLEGKSSPVESCEDCDDWRDEAVWPKANPNLGVSVSHRYLRDLVAEAVAMPTKRNIVQRLNFCIWNESITRWIPDEVWAANEGAVDELAGRECYAGVVVASANEMFALVLWFPDEDGGGDVATYLWMPLEGIVERSQREQVPWSAWVGDSLIEGVEGPVMDRDVVRSKLKELADVYNIREIGVMKFNAQDLGMKLEDDGFEVYLYSPTMGDMSDPTKKLEEMLVEAKVCTGGNAVLRYQVANVAVKRDYELRVRPDKEASKGPFQGIEGLIVAIGRWLAAEDLSEWGAV